MTTIRLVAELKGHLDCVWSLAWNPKGNILASCGADKSIRLWKMPDNFEKKMSQEWEIQGSNNLEWSTLSTIDDAHKRTIRHVSFSPDGKYIASASFDSTTSIWQYEASGEEFECIATLEGHENEVKSVCWSPSGQLLATCSRDKSVWIWGVSEDDFECISVLQEHTQDVKCLVWHPKDELLASGSYDNTIKLWIDEDDDWYCMETLQGHTSTIWSLDFNSTGDVLASCSDDKSVKFWKSNRRTSTVAADWECIHTLENAHERCIFSLSWSKIHNMMLTASNDNSIRLFKTSFETNLPTILAQEIRNAHGQMDANVVQWNPHPNYSHFFASGGDDGIVRIWQVVE